MTENPAYFMDGETARRLEVSLTYAQKSIVITDRQGSCISTWDVAGISTLDKIVPAKAFVLSCAKRGAARLRIEDEQTKAWLFNIIPSLARRYEYKKESCLAIKLSAAVVLIALLGYLAFPLIAKGIVQLIPADYENEIFEGAGIAIAKEFGAKRACVEPEAQAILQGMLIRLIGDEKAKSVSLMVVDHEMVNAFATPGRQVIMMGGLIDKAMGPDEVIGVLAHELGHVEERHPMQGVIRGAGLTFVLSLFLGGDWVDVTSFLAETSYSRDNERDADRFALAVLGDANIRTLGLAAFFERLDKENHTVEKVLQLVSTHPMSEERAKMIRAQTGGAVSMNASQWAKLKNICSKKKTF
jgi:beta-barrel assembly-enhancing protease